MSDPSQRSPTKESQAPGPSPNVIGSAQSSNPIVESSNSSSARTDGGVSRPLLDGENAAVSSVLPKSPKASVHPRVSADPDPLQFHQRLVYHRMASERLHALGGSMKFGDKLKYLQQGHCLNRFATSLSLSSGHVEISTGKHALERKSTGHRMTDARHTLDLQAIGEEVQNNESYCQDKFNESLQYETISASFPDSLPLTDVPRCSCGAACSLRQHLDPEYRGMCMWVCSLGTCMYWAPATALPTTHRDDCDYDYDDGDADHENSAHYFGGGGDHDVFRLSADVTDDDFDVALVETLVQSNNTAGFWSEVDKIAMDLDAETAGILTSNVDMPKCDCGLPAGCMLCRVTGVLFFTCQKKSCMFLIEGQGDLLQEIGEMDIGQRNKMGESTLDRHTTLQYAMRWLGYTFSQKYWRSFSKRSPTCDYEKGSYQMHPGQEYSGFLSYRGGSGRFAIQSALCGQFNLMPGFYFLVIACPIIAICLSFVKDTCADGYNASRAWLVWSNGCQEPDINRQWFLFRGFGPVILVLIVVFWHPTFSWFYRNHKLFIDKLKNVNTSIIYLFQ